MLLVSFISKREKKEYDGEDTCTNEGHESAIPTVKVNHETHEGTSISGTDEC
jgi:hypothetical protein